MQRVICSIFVVGALSLTGLTACGDKITNVQNSDSTVTAVSVSPPSASLNVGDKITLVATVTANGNPNRSVTWSTGNAAVATVDANGQVTATGGGTTSIIATSVSNTAVKGAAAITVGAVVQPTVTVASITQGNITAQLGNIAGQLDVTVNVDAGTQKVSKVDLIVNCGGADTVVATQTIGAGDVAPLGAEASASTVQMSFNTAAFNAANGTVAFKNGACTLKARATTTSGIIVASNGTPFTLNNLDTVSATITNTPTGTQKASATDGTGLLWKAGTVTVTAVPIIYSSGITAATGSINLVNISGVAGTKGSTPGNVANNTVFASLTGITATGGVLTGTFPKDMSASGVDSTTIAGVGVAVTTVTSAGNAGPSVAASLTNIIRLDNLAPDKTAPTIDLTKFNAANNWLGKNFVFTTAAGSVTLGTAATDNGGVDVVSFTTQSAPFGTTTWTTFANVTGLAETSTASSTGSYILRLVVCDALNNCTNTANLTATGFGVDLTPPSIAVLSGPTDHEIFNIDSVVPSLASFSVSDTSNTAGVTPSGPTAGAEVLVTLQGLQPSGASSSKTICSIGTPTGSSPAITCKSAVTQNQAGVPLPVTAGEYTMTVIGIDQAGNQSAPTTIRWYDDQKGPSVSGGVTIPASITTGTSFTLNAADSMDVAAGSGALFFTTANVSFFEAGTSSVNGVAFDNVLTRTGTVTVPLTTFYRSVSTAPGTTAGEAPAGLHMRAVDAAGNLSADTLISFPAGNLSAPGIISSTSTSNGITAAAVFVAPNPVDPNKPVVLSDTLTAISSTSASPFTQVCFYYQVPAGHVPAVNSAAAGGAATGDLVKISCTSSLSASGVAPRLLSYKVTWTVPAAFANSSVSIFAVGITSNLDALVTGPVALAVNPTPP
jgi:hypothetical protein